MQRNLFCIITFQVNLFVVLELHWDTDLHGKANRHIRATFRSKRAQKRQTYITLQEITNLRFYGRTGKLYVSPEQTGSMIEVLSYHTLKKYQGKFQILCQSRRLR
jgi:hypothetical protein